MEKQRVTQDELKVGDKVRFNVNLYAIDEFTTEYIKKQNEVFQRLMTEFKRKDFVYEIPTYFSIYSEGIGRYE